MTTRRTLSDAQLKKAADRKVGYVKASCEDVSDEVTMEVVRSLTPAQEAMLLPDYNGGGTAVNRVSGISARVIAENAEKVLELLDKADADIEAGRTAEEGGIDIYLWARGGKKNVTK